MADNKNIDEDIQITVRHVMQGKEVGSIIGKNGETVKSLRDESGARIYISDSSSPERIVTVTGGMDSLFRAFSLITKKIEEFYRHQYKTDETQNISLRLIVPASQCGSIIGKGGAQIKTIRDTSGASVFVASDMLPNSTEREVNIRGDPEAVTQAIYQICLIMVDTPPKGATIPYRPISQNAGSALLGNQFGMQGGMMGNRADMGGNPLASLAALGLGNIGNLPGGISATALAALASSQLKTNNMNNRNNAGGNQNKQSNHITKEMTVPNELVGAVIGKGGTKIFEIRKISGAMIRISKSSDDNDSVDRVITMQGTPDSIALAQYLINMSVELLKANLNNGQNGNQNNGGQDDVFQENNFNNQSNDIPSLASLNQANPLAAALPQLAQILNKPGALNALTSLSALGGLSDLLGGGGGVGQGIGGLAVPPSPNYSNVQTTGVHRRTNKNRGGNNKNGNSGGRSNPY